ncbi:DNA mismatch repair ATPase msh1 [Phytophthora boehmeriae]|uniref:DNA mismatch repair ATPase msh1 n=1 Tax=Phytophthora boehmeriae TaxID=109152 RepID=A0A8T1WZM2_9STRA|nr:DNA mismatch repair ATPase msh1 [Phytophthora boehmeriae]
MFINTVRYDTPLVMQAASSYDQRSQFPVSVPIYLGDVGEKIKVVVLHRSHEGGVVIRSADDSLELIVADTGDCFFESSVLGIAEKFDVEILPNQSVAFVSCRTGNVLEPDDSGMPRCVDTIRRGWFLLQHSVANELSEGAVLKVPPVVSLPCSLCDKSKERCEYIMMLVALGKSLEEIDAILLRMYTWPVAGTVDGG